MVFKWSFIGDCRGKSMMNEREQAFNQIFATEIVKYLKLTPAEQKRYREEALSYKEHAEITLTEMCARFGITNVAEEVNCDFYDSWKGYAFRIIAANEDKLRWEDVNIVAMEIIYGFMFNPLVEAMKKGDAHKTLLDISYNLTQLQKNRNEDLQWLAAVCKYWSNKINEDESL